MPTLNVTTSVVDYLTSKGQDSSFANRAKLAANAGISNYTGTAAQNTLLLSKLSTPAPAAPVAPPATSPNANIPSASPASSTYVIKGGDTLSAIARAQGTSVAELMKLNPQITNPNLIRAGGSLNMPGQAGSVPDYSAVNDVKSANEIINANQSADASKANTLGEPETRKTVEDIISEITSQVSPKTAKPATPNYEQSLTNYRTEYGVTDLENQLNDLKAQEQEILDIKSSRVATERGKPVAMNVIEGRVGQTERQENERLAVIQRSISNVTNQLNTKYNIVNTLMKTKEMDYEAASSAYDKELSQNISIFNAARNVDEANKSELEREQDNARASAQIMLNAYTAQGLTYNDLPSTEKTNLTKLGVQSGLGADFFTNALKASVGKDILTTVVSADDTKATIIYKDGTTKTIATGLPVKKTSTSEPKATESEIKVFYKQSMEKELQKVVGEDGFVSPESWATARRKWSSNTSYTSSDFDDAFRGFVNPTHPQDYAGYESYKSGFIKKSSAELEAGE